MHQILVWPLSSEFSLVFSSQKSDLGNITCCDRLTLSFKNNDHSITLISDMPGCDLEKLQKILKSLIDEQMLQAWARQLELLQVVMEENELEKKSHGKGCC